MMAVPDHVNIDQCMAGSRRTNPGETDFQQAVYDVAADVFDTVRDKVICH